MTNKLFEIKKNGEGYGYLIEKDAGYIDINDKRNSNVIQELNNITSKNRIDTITVVDRLKVFAVFQKYGIQNANGRIYPEKILKNQVDVYQHKIDERQSYGELNHPESVTINGERLTFLVTKLWWEGQTLVGEIELILSPGFVNYGVISCLGDMVANYLRLGIKIGVSSRGLGSVEKDKYTGKYFVQDDFELTCWDIVTDPSTPGSYISPEMSNLNRYFESKMEAKNKIIEGIDSYLTKKKILT